MLNFERIKTSLDLILLATDQSPFTVPKNLALNCERKTYDYPEMYYNGTLFSQQLFHLLKNTIYLSEISVEHNRRSLLRSLSKLGPCRLGHLLLQSCEDLFYFKSISLVRVLLDAGAEPNVVFDKNEGNTCSIFLKRF